VSCGGAGCDDCQDGRWKLTECPVVYIGSAMVRRIADALKLVRFARHGLLPVGGGVLNQTIWFRDFCDFAWRHQDAIKAEQQAAAYGY